MTVLHFCMSGFEIAGRKFFDHHRPYVMSKRTLPAGIVRLFCLWNMVAPAFIIEEYG